MKPFLEQYNAVRITPIPEYKLNGARCFGLVVEVGREDAFGVR